jgi:hypothetical protein
MSANQPHFILFIMERVQALIILELWPVRGQKIVCVASTGLNYRGLKKHLPGPPLGMWDISLPLGGTPGKDSLKNAGEIGEIKLDPTLQPRTRDCHRQMLKKTARITLW